MLIIFIVTFIIVTSHSLCVHQNGNRNQLSRLVTIFLEIIMLMKCDHRFFQFKIHMSTLLFHCQVVQEENHM